MRTESGLVLVQRNPYRAVDVYGVSRAKHWLYYKHPDGQWVTLRKCEPWEIMQAEDQDSEDIVLDGGEKQ